MPVIGRLTPKSQAPNAIFVPLTVSYDCYNRRHPSIVILWLVAKIANVPLHQPQGIVLTTPNVGQQLISEERASLPRLMNKPGRAYSMGIKSSALPSSALMGSCQAYSKR